MFFLQKKFFHVRDAKTEAEFDSRWKTFVANFDAKPAMVAYLQNEIFPHRERWGLAWVDCAYHAGLMATSLGESFHSLLASGVSAHRTHPQLFQLVDSISLMQLQKHNRRISEWEQEKLKLEESSIPGFVLPSVLGLLSAHAFQEMRTLQLQSTRMTVKQIPRTDVLVCSSWNVFDLRYPQGGPHVVVQVDSSAIPANPVSNVHAAQIRAAMSRKGERLSF